jgi:hypothetical protein
MLPDNISGDGTNPDEGENADIISHGKVPRNEQLEKEKEYQQDQSNNKASGDPTAARYTGARGYTQRDNQKDQLENLHIHGDDTHPGGGTNHSDPNEQSQGPGFETEGSVDLSNGVRSQDQDFGDKEPSGPVKPADEAFGQ